MIKFILAFDLLLLFSMYVLTVWAGWTMINQVKKFMDRLND